MFNHHFFKSNFVFFQHVLLKIASFHSAFMEKIEVRSCRLGQKKTAVTVAKFMGTPWAYLPISLPTFNAAWLAYEPYMERKGKLKLDTCPTAPKIE